MASGGEDDRESGEGRGSLTTVIPLKRGIQKQ